MRKRVFVGIIIALFTVLIASICFAQDKADEPKEKKEKAAKTAKYYKITEPYWRVVLNPFVGFHTFSSNIKANVAYGFDVTYHWNEGVGTGAEFNRTSTKDKDGIFDVDITDVLLAVKFNSRDKGKNYYFKVGLGQRSVSIGDDSNSSTVITGGLGFQFVPQYARYIPGGEATYLGSDTQGAAAHIGVGVGIGEMKDDDKDGILNKRDQCAATPQGAKVDTRGCSIDTDNDGVADGIDKCDESPAGSLVDSETGCPPDEDKDRVPDTSDKCLKTPIGASVNADGCPKDDDGDGVFDGLDKCTMTPDGIEVDNTGCSPEQIKEREEREKAAKEAAEAHEKEKQKNRRRVDNYNPGHWCRDSFYLFALIAIPR